VPTANGINLQVTFMIPKNIAVIGSTTIDTIIKKDLRGHFKPGGVTTYSGITYSRHDIVTHVVTNVAARDSLILDNLSKENIYIHNGFTEYTTQFVNYIDGDNRHQRIPRTARSINYDQVIEVVDMVDWIHLGPLHPLDMELAVLGLLKNSGLLIFLDIQGYVRYTKDKTVYPRMSRYATDALATAQIVKAHEVELNIILRDCQMNLDDLMIKYHIEEFVVTRGQMGGFVKLIDTEEIEFKAVPIRKLDDPTGAGDVFFAAYIIGRCAEKKDAGDACNYAARLSARQLEGRYIQTTEFSPHHLEG
jgi:sugar/nucleoside kinase (ribokinase family)